MAHTNRRHSPFVFTYRNKTKLKNLIINLFNAIHVVFSNMRKYFCSTLYKSLFKWTFYENTIFVINKNHNVIAKIYFGNKTFTKSLRGKNERICGLNAIKREKKYMCMCAYVCLCVITHTMKARLSYAARK